LVFSRAEKTSEFLNEAVFWAQKTQIKVKYVRATSGFSLLYIQNPNPQFLSKKSSTVIPIDELVTVSATGTN